MAVELDTMEVKKTTSEVSKDGRELSVQESVSKASRMASFLSDVKSELKKINWTTKEDLRNLTKIVIAWTFCFGMGVYFADLMIQGMLATLESMIRLIGG